jgi:putative ABC transport system permease protein
MKVKLLSIVIVLLHLKMEELLAMSNSSSFNHSPKLFLWENLSLALRSISVNKLRTFLTSLGIIIGVAAVLIVVTVIDNYNNHVVRLIKSNGADIVKVSGNLVMQNSRKLDVGVFSSPEPTDFMSFLSQDDRPVALTNHDILAIQRNILGISDISAYVDASTAMWPRNIFYENQQIMGMGVKGVTKDYVRIRNLSLQAGRFISDLDNHQKRNVCVLGEQEIQELGITGDPIGVTVRFNDQWFKVVGVVKKRDFFLGRSIFIPYTTAKYFIEKSWDIPNLTVFFKIDDIDSTFKTVNNVNRLLNIRHDLDINSKLFQIEASKERVDRLQSQIDMNATVFIAIVGVSLLVGGIGIMNMMLVSVTERTKEIGICKAVGASRTHIMLQFLIEAFIISLLAGIVGLLLGSLLTGIATSFIETLPTTWFTMKGSIIAFSCAVTTGVAFGIMPAAKASKLNAIDALRYE